MRREREGNTAASRKHNKRKCGFRQGQNEGFIENSPTSYLTKYSRLEFLAKYVKRFNEVAIKAVMVRQTADETSK